MKNIIIALGAVLLGTSTIGLAQPAPAAVPVLSVSGSYAQKLTVNYLVPIGETYTLTASCHLKNNSGNVVGASFDCVGCEGASFNFSVK